MWPMAVAVGIAAIWFEWSYRRNRPSRKQKAPSPPKKETASARNPPPKQLSKSS